MDKEPRTANDIMRDLLNFAEEMEWEGRTNTTCHCHPEYARCCPKCGVVYKSGYEKHGKYSDYVVLSEHTPDCELKRLILETKAYLVAEEEIKKAREEEAFNLEIEPRR